MLWPRARRASSSGADETMVTTGGDGVGGPPLWTQYSASTEATDYNDTNEQDENGHDDDDNIAWSQPHSPPWEAPSHLAESPLIPSAQPVFYPFSLPASGIRPLTPPSPLPRHLDFGDSLGSEFDTDSEVDDLLEDILQAVSGVTL
ncbi:hypothetical protein NLG97_g7576 [Lecanicillium saksenae]|uniref:Uncharacterized protein n=1 Tax=Lecanicillium saksenae TaxID=468837 RepID=A0ACC1QMZ5_9HYPO|nr:hypothetical protein NLG97_g7576 [Lecanicillium saksenae]